MDPKIPPIKPGESIRFQEGITLKMTAKGYYYWDINAFGELGDDMISKIKQIDDKLRQIFPQNVTTLPTEIASINE